jgi:hypothetical protein
MLSSAKAVQLLTSTETVNRESWEVWEKAAFSARLADSIQHQELPQPKISLTGHPLFRQLAIPRASLVMHYLTTHFTLAIAVVALVVGSANAEQHYSLSDATLDPAPVLPTAAWRQVSDSQEQEIDDDVATPSSSCWESCSDCNRWSARVSYYLMWQHGRSLPPLATTSPDTTPRPQAGVLGQPDTEILFGGERVGQGERSGVGLNLEYLLDCRCDLALGGGILWFDNDEADFFRATDGSFILGVPFFNAETGLEAASLLGFPNENAGFLDIRDSHEVYGADIYLKKLDCACGPVNLHVMLGYNFYQINNDLSIHQYTEFIGNPVNINVRDLFSTENQFHGGTLGFEATRDYDCWTFSLMARVSIGNMHQSVDIDGSTIAEVNGVPGPPLNGGLFAQASNIGSYSRNKLAAVPQVQLRLSRQINDCWQASAGYSFLYWSDVVHAGDQIDRNVNLSQLGPFPVPPLVPVFDFRSTSDWMHGLNLSLTRTF